MIHATNRIARVTLVVVWTAMSLGCVSHRLNLSAQQDAGNGESPSPLSLPSLVASPEVKRLARGCNETRAVLLPFFEMAAVESRHNPFAVGDSGRAIGMYQIHHAYWKDSGMPGRWEDCRDPAYSQRVVMAYWKRYCPDALRRGDLEVLCRVHNGGPQGYKKPHTVGYWQRIQAVSITAALSPISAVETL